MLNVVYYYDEYKHVTEIDKILDAQLVKLCNWFVFTLSAFLVVSILN